MSLLAILLAAQGPLVLPDDPPEIVVVARRLESVSVNVGQGPDGKWYCGMDKSSGVASLDSKLCKAVTKCVRKGADNQQAVEACIAGSKRRLFERWKREARARS